MGLRKRRGGGGAGAGQREHDDREEEEEEGEQEQEGRRGEWGRRLEVASAHLSVNGPSSVPDFMFCFLPVRPRPLEMP